MSLRYALSRLAQMLLVLWGAFTASFVLLYLMPGDPVRLMLSGTAQSQQDVPLAQIRQLRHEYGFDKPILAQYLNALAKASHGDFGRSLQSGDTVTHMLVTALPNTIQLTALGLIFGTILAFAFAVASSHVRSRQLSGLLSSIPVIGVCVPSFWVGILLLVGRRF